MKRTFYPWQFLGFAFTCFCGTLLHYVYDWSGGALLAAPFSGVNESTWEHMKLLFWPMLLFALLEQAFFRGRRDFWCIKTKGMLVGLVSIPVLFYTLGGVFAPTSAPINIAIFFISAAAAYLYECKRFAATPSRCPRRIAYVVLLLLALAFVLFSFSAYTPHLGIFKDPINGSFGI